MGQDDVGLADGSERAPERVSVGSEGSKVSGVALVLGGLCCIPWFWLMVGEGHGRDVRWTMCAAWALPLAWKLGL